MKGNKNLAKLLAEDTDDEEKLGTPSPTADASQPWKTEFNRYLDGNDEVPNGMSLPRWWGVNSSNLHVLLSSSADFLFLQIHSSRLPVWASLARDYLAIMGSSVSSERAFSSAGITITKRRNRLKGDIVEALQFIKCLLRKDLIFREPLPTSALEHNLEVVDDDGDVDWVDEDERKSWDNLSIEVEDSDDEP